MLKHTEGVSLVDASARITGRRVLLAAVTAAVLAGCASYHPAPIVHRSPTTRAGQVPTTPAPVPPVATVPAAPTAPAPAPVEEPLVVETIPMPGSGALARPLPGPGGTLAAPPPPQSSNMLKTEPRATKQPYSEALLAQLRASSAPAADSPGPVAVAPPSAPAPAPPAAPAASAAPATGSGFIWPANGQVVQGFSEPRSMGISIAGKPGDPIVAASGGRVIFSGPGPRGYGNLLIVKHDAETLSVYAHNRTLLVKEGQDVKRGQRIAELGSSGTDSPKLHFEIRKQGKPVDPRKFLPAR